MIDVFHSAAGNVVQRAAIVLYRVPIAFVFA